MNDLFSESTHNCMMIFEIPPNFGGEKRKKDFSAAKSKEKKRKEKKIPSRHFGNGKHVTA